MNNEDKLIYKKANKGTCWPTKEQELLLRAVLLQGIDGMNAWRDWKSSVEIEQIDHGSYRLLPLLYRSLRTHGVEDPLMDKLKGVYRMTWYKNQVLFNRMSRLLRAFQDAAIQTMIIKGAALTLLYYKDCGLRPMNDFDVLVRTERTPEAINLLVKLGWRPPKEIHVEAFTDEYLSTKGACIFEDATGCQLDFHWHLLKQCCYENADNNFWDSSVTTKLNAISTYALNPTDQLLHTCVHGVGWDPVPPIYWVADAMMIINTSKPNISWNRLTNQIQERRLILQLRDTLNYLRDLLNPPIPFSVLQSMQNMTVSRTEHAEYQTTASHPGLVGRVLRLWFYYLRSSQPVGNTALQPKLIGFPRFLQHTWMLHHLWHVPFYAVYRLIRLFYNA